jgi:hypothetical protein
MNLALPLMRTELLRGAHGRFEQACAPMLMLMPMHRKMVL